MMKLASAIGLLLSVICTAQAQESPQSGMEVFAALPVSHDVTMRDTGKVAELKQLTSTASLQYHFFDPNGRIHAYVGVGLNYTSCMGESTTGVLAGTDLKLDSSLGPAAAYALGMSLGRRLQ